MKKLVPLMVIKPKPYIIHSVWGDGFKASIKLEQFREYCPCAECQGDKLNNKDKSYLPLMKTYKPGMNELVSLKPVGNYAINPVWGDGHDTGIYTWEYFREVFERLALSEEELDEMEKKLQI